MSMNIRPQVYPTTAGHVIGSMFGLVFVLVNGEILPTVLRIVVDAVAIAVLVVVVGATAVTERVHIHTGGERYGRFPAKFWIVAAVEAVLLFGGLYFLGRAEPAANLGWIALVVGAHFFPLSRLFPHGKQQFIGIGTAMSILGAALLGTSAVNAIHTLTIHNGPPHRTEFH